MKILALITARGGSKRIPGKNIRKLCGKPLIEWSIDSAKNIGDICDVLVSTDDQLIADISRKAGAMVPWLRPSEMAQDDSSSVPTSLHALDWYQSNYGQVDGLLLLQPTSPFRTRKTIIKGIKLFEKNSMQSVISFSPVEEHPFWCFKLENGVMKKFISNQEQHFQSQDLPPVYIANGAFYLISPDNLKNNQSFYEGSIVPLIIDNYKESVDIDNEQDWEFAEMMCSKSNSKQ
jgi:CMP-N,N'-diacetyllegionaminic acid synthase